MKKLIATVSVLVFGVCSLAVATEPACSHKPSVLPKSRILLKSGIPPNSRVLSALYENFTWIMSFNERNMFKKYLSDATRYLEFGSGGSTIAALMYFGVPVISVDSSKEWFDHMVADFPVIKNNENSVRLSLHHVDIGKIKGWGWPEDSSGRARYPNYSSSVFSIEDAKNSDLVLVDGRFRVACILSVLLNTKPDTIIMVHDFWNREHYHSILKYVDVVDRVDTLGVFRRKKEAKDSDIATEYEKFKYTAD
ncbi:hypothetical protein FACS189449_00440 [Alphaproteobacteria bacterium]|nr:hypothetical protein FACS189449_00440 [Alphaproteobacteria bacterium]